MRDTRACPKPSCESKFCSFFNCALFVRVFFSHKNAFSRPGYKYVLVVATGSKIGTNFFYHR